MQLLTTFARDQGDERLSDVEPGFEPSGAVRARVLLTAALGPLITGYAAVASLLTLITLTAEKAQFSTTGVLLAAGPGWLAAHQVPIEITGHPLGLLPLLPTMGVGLLIARTAGGAAQRLGCREPVQAFAVIGVVAGAHATFGLVIAMISRGSPLAAGPVTAFVVPGLFAALTASAGLAVRCGLVRAVRAYLDPAALHGLRAGALGMAALLACGAVVFTLSLILSTSTVYDLFEPGFGGSFGLFLLSAGYLPNAIVAGLSFAAGPGFSIGSVSVSVVGFSGGPVPGVPLLAGIPEQRAAWWPLLMLLPVAVGALVGWSVRKIDEDPIARLRAVGVAGALVGFGCVLLGTLAGGRLGDGPWDPVSVPVGVASVVTFGWIVIPGCFVAFFCGPHEPASLPGGGDAEVDLEGSEELDEIGETETGEIEEGETAEGETAEGETEEGAVEADVKDDVVKDDVRPEDGETDETDESDREPEPTADAEVTESIVGSGDDKESDADG